MSVHHPDPAPALALLGPHLEEPVMRAQRISGIYALLFLESPFLHQWCGLAAFVARHVYMALESNPPGMQRFMGEANLAVFQTATPAFLQWRAGQPVAGAMAPAFATLNQARAALERAETAPLAEAYARNALGQLCDLEQSLVLQPHYQALGPVRRALLSGVCMFRMGFDSAAPIIDFPGGDAADLQIRNAWMHNTVLAHWHDARATRMAELRADCNRIRREAGLPGDLLG